MSPYVLNCYLIETLSLKVLLLSSGYLSLIGKNVVFYEEKLKIEQ